jgi:hypothetical protein
MLKKLIISMLLFSALVGCAATQNIYIDGMPVSDHEYVANTPEGLRASFILTRYYEKKFDDETMIYPEYLDMFGQDMKINIDNTEALILHLKIVNVKRIPIVIWYTVNGPTEKIHNILYRGKLPRKDLSIDMPTDKSGTFDFEVVLVGEKEELFNVWGKYQNERGDK